MVGMGVLSVDGFFLLEAEDGIRDYEVTGVQACALPIFTDQGLGDAARDGEAAGNLFWEFRPPSSWPQHPKLVSNKRPPSFRGRTGAFYLRFW